MTAQFPHGKLNDEDEGEMGVLVGLEGDVCVIAFPAPTTWIGLTAAELRPFIDALQAHLAVLEGGAPF